MESLADLVAPFAQLTKSRQTEVYNEFSLQHELGIFLRTKLRDCKVQFERNVSFFFPLKSSFTKREIDIAAFPAKKTELRYAIELKHPRNGQYPEQMFSFCKDLAFGEEVRAAGFHCAGLVNFADDPLFYEGPGEGIYRFFRSGNPINGRVQKPTGSKEGEVLIRGSYVVKWKPIIGSLRYAVIEVANVG